MIKNRFKKIIIGTLLSLLVFGFAYGLFIYFVFFYPYRTSWVSFDSSEWQNGETKFDEDIRYRMHKDLLKKYKIVGMAEADLVQLLGPESKTDKFKNWDLVYWMGPEPGAFAIDSIWLLLDIEDGKVKEFKVMTD
ncbi:hypothetical protein HYV57_05425 [Candidatus Peregrinibacteria bacterium]|nr:hypothetical protein [Candidatus Peregrinibacteria bacterium]